ncbi:hypothetical protein GCM10009639_33360 [Kitasatospora putterlickiae]|uniref:Uncharacterized protein n=1 Tax=Kitasatospora putterlickiae TaxID=221725 RepID=A0ABP4IWD0_9ACTN
MQVPVEEPPAGGVRLGGAGQVAGVGAQQVVQPEPAGRPFLHQVGVGQARQQRGRRGRGRVGQRGGAVRAEVRAGHQAEQPEHPLGRGRERAVGEVEGGPYRRAPVAFDVQPAEHVAARQLGAVVGDPGAAGDQVGAGDPDGQRQAAAEPDELAGRLLLGRDPALADGAGQQPAGLLRAEHVQAELAGAVAGDQPGEPAAAGDQHGAARGARDQRPDLFGVASVVQHDQHPLAGEQRAVQRGGLVLVRGQPLGPDAQRAEEAGEHVARAQRREPGVAAQVDEQLPVLEQFAPCVRPVRGEGGLADAGRADQRHQVRAVRRVGGDEGVQLRQVLFPPDVESGRGGQLGRARGGGRRAADRCEGQLAAQHPQVGVLDLGAGRDAQLLVEPVAQASEHVERGGLLPGAREGQDQPGVQALVQRFGGHQLRQHRNGPLGAVQQQGGVGVQQGRADPPFVRRHRGRMPSQRRVRVREHRAPPVPQGPRQRFERGLLVRCALLAPGQLQQFVEPAEVGLLAGGLQQVAGGGADDGRRRGGPRAVGFQQPADLADVAVDEALVGAGRSGRPEDVGDLPLGGGPGMLEGQQPEQAAQHRAGDRDRGAAVLEDERAEEQQPRPPRAARRPGAGGGQQVGQLAAGQLQRLGEPSHGVRPGPSDPSVFEVAQCPGADPGPGRGRLLAQPGPPAVRLELSAERLRPARRHLRHGVPLIGDQCGPDRSTGQGPSGAGEAGGGEVRGGGRGGGRPGRRW